MRTTITRSRTGTGSGESAKYLKITTALMAAVITALSVTACSGAPASTASPTPPAPTASPTASATGHAGVVARLPIPFRPSSASGKDVIPIKVAVGDRFSILVATSDGPFAWSQSVRPDPGLVRLIGDSNVGSCASGLIGCRVPYFHTLMAKHRGTTTMTWKYRYFGSCPSPSAGASPCVSEAEVTFNITIR